MTADLRSERSLHACVDPTCLDKVHELLAELWTEAADVADVDRTLFELAVMEVAGNIVQHSVSDDVILCNLHVQVFDTRLDALFLDTAQEVIVNLTAAHLPDDMAESGRGLAMTIGAVDQLSYQREGALNCWRLSRTRTG